MCRSTFLTKPREFENASDIFESLEMYRTPEDQAAVLVTTMFPAILSDMLHCFCGLLAPAFRLCA
jgi:hypothetical protein